MCNYYMRMRYYDPCYPCPPPYYDYPGYPDYYWNRPLLFQYPYYRY